MIDELLIKLGNSKSDLKRNDSVESFTQIAYPESLDGSDSNGNPTPIQIPSTKSSPNSPMSQQSRDSLREQHNSTSSSDDWQISLNQFLATSVLANSISEFFSKRISLKESVERMQKNRIKCILPNY